MATFVLEMLQQKFGEDILAVHRDHGDDTALVRPERILEICRYLRDDPQLQFAMLIDLTVVDRLQLPGDLNRFNAGPRGTDHLAARHHQLREAAAYTQAPAAIAAERFEVVYHLLSIATNQRVRLKTSLPADDPRLSSVRSLWKGANWPEREAYDMFGVTFEGHGDLRRLLMYDEFVGHPLRKDYPRTQEQPLVALRPIADAFPTQANPTPELLTPPR